MHLPVNLLRKTVSAQKASETDASAAATSTSSSASSTAPAPFSPTASALAGAAKPGAAASSATAAASATSLASPSGFSVAGGFAQQSLSLFNRGAAAPAADPNLVSLPPMLCMGGRPGIDAPPHGPDPMQMPPPGLVLLMLLGLTQRISNPSKYLVRERERMRERYCLISLPSAVPCLCSILSVLTLYRIFDALLICCTLMISEESLRP
jgi:hypothetical protein